MSVGAEWRCEFVDRLGRLSSSWRFHFCSISQSSGAMTTASVASRPAADCPDYLQCRVNDFRLQYSIDLMIQFVQNIADDISNLH